MEGLPRIVEQKPTEGGGCAPLSREEPAHYNGCSKAQNRHSASIITASSIVVRRGRIVCEVKLPDVRFRYTNSQLARRVLERYPSLSHHACVNAEGRTFGCVMDHTSMAHLLEHLVIELQTQASTNPSAVFVGTSEWIDEAAGIARVEVSFCDDLQALRALNEALDIIDGLV